MTIYLYVKTHNETGLKYLGKTVAKDPHKYPGSGVYWRRHLDKHGYTYTTEILKECQTNAELAAWGEYYSRLWDVAESNEWANLTPESGAGADSETQKKIWADPDLRKRLSEKMKSICSDPVVKDKRSKIWADPDRRKRQAETQKHIAETRPEIGRKKSRPGNLNGMYGKTHSQEVKEKLASGPRIRFGGKTYEEIYGKDRAEELKKDKSNKLKKYLRNNPSSRTGSNNPKALKYTVVSPIGIEYNLHGTLNQFCKENNLNYVGLLSSLKTGKQPVIGKNAGWEIYHPASS